nr:hypothetical protein BdHM001_36130 [Bdellovibrio sp. HM001]
MKTSHLEMIAKCLSSKVPGTSYRLSDSEIHLFTDDKELKLSIYERPATLSVNEAFHGTEKDRSDKMASREYVLNGEVDNNYHTEIDLVLNVHSDGNVEVADYYPLTAIKRHFSPR